MKNFTKAVQRVAVHVGIFAQPVQLPGADTVHFDQLVLADIFFFHRFPQLIKYDQSAHPEKAYHPSPPLDNCPQTGYNIKMKDYSCIFDTIMLK